MSDQFLGEIRIWGLNFAPRGWAFCNGQLLSIAANTALFALLGTTYGGDGRTNFGLPDLRGRVPMHAGAGTGPGLSRRTIGQKVGVESVTLTAAQLPSHDHQLSGSTDLAAGTTPGGNVLAAADVNVYGTVQTDYMPDSVLTPGVGGGGAHNNLQPYLALNFCIALTGIFPSRS